MMSLVLAGHDNLVGSDRAPRAHLLRALGFATILVVLGAMPASGDSLLTTEYETQLDAWLGDEGGEFSLVYDNVRDGIDPSFFHQLVDNVGPTITLVEVRNTLGNQRQIIGGYNPVSWDKTINGWVLTPDAADRDAFIFNLTHGVIQMQNRDTALGAHQTRNAPSYGPSFGGGPDLQVKSYSGEAYQMSYGSGGVNILGKSTFTYFDVGRVETYAVVPLRKAAAPIPEPASACLLGAAMVALAVRRRFRVHTKASPPTDTGSHRTPA